MTESQRNLLILLAVAVAGVIFSGAFGTGTAFASSLLNITFTILMVAFAVMLYRRHSSTIAMIPSTPRLVLQACTVVFVGTFLTGTLTIGNLLPWPFGWSHAYPLAFWGVLFASGFGIWWGWQQRTSRW